MTGPRAPRCPGCEQPPRLLVDIQAFCGNEDCRVFCWDVNDDPAQFLAKAQYIDLPDWLSPPDPGQDHPDSGVIPK